ncbi:MAG: VOC family protein [Chloroflexi bacterium]|nr:VOC family protein [Chloroflexota bacterium]
MAAIGRLGMFVLDVNDVERAAAFWSALLGVEVGHAMPGFTMLKAQDGTSALALQEVPEPKSGKNRAHPNLNVENLEEAERQIHELGGTTVSQEEFGAMRWSVMADPDGNEFCIAVMM